jgi:hypothetical protein
MILKKQQELIINIFGLILRNDDYGFLRSVKYMLKMVLIFFSGNLVFDQYLILIQKKASNAKEEN